MKKIYLISAFIFFLLTFVSVYSFAQKKVDFNINLDAGACFEVKSSTTSASQSNKPKESKSEVNTTVRYQVVKKTPDVYHLNFMYTEFYSATTGIRDMIIDPKKADTLNILDVSTQTLMVMNKPFSAEVSPKGKINTVKGNKKIEAELKQKTKSLTPELRNQVSFVVNSFSEDQALEELIESWASYIPASAVKIGDSWTIQKDSTITRYTFVAETNATYNIEGVGSKKTTVKNEIMGITMTTNSEEQYTLTIEIDKRTFLPNIIHKESDLSSTVNMPSNPAFPSQQSKSKNTSTIKINRCN